MPVVSNTATVTPLVGVPQDCGDIIGGPFDNVSVYFTGGLGGGNGPLGLKLFAVVAGVRTLIATALMQGTKIATLVEFQLEQTAGETSSFLVGAGGAEYVVTIQDLSGTVPPNAQPRQPVTITIAGVNEFDTAPDAQFAASLTVGAGGIGQLPVIAGFAQQMDVAIDQSRLPAVTVQVLADCGPGSVQAVVDTKDMQGTNNGVAGVFRNLRLPVATRYFVQFKNNSQNTVTLTLTAASYSLAVTAGGAVALLGDVIGPSNANTVIKWRGVPLDPATMAAPVAGDVPVFTAGQWVATPLAGAIALLGDVIGPANNNKVIKWDNIPLTLAGPGTFGPPIDAALPIFDAGTGFWRALLLGQDVIVDNNGFVKVGAWLNQPLDPATMGAPVNGDVPVWDGVGNVWKAAPVGAAVTLIGNTNGPANNNTDQHFPTSTTDADVNIGASAHPHGFIYEGLNGLTANRTVLLNAAPTPGDQVIVKDEDGSLNNFNIIVNGNGKLIDANGVYTMTQAQNGAFGSVTLVYTGTAWAIV